MNEHEIICESKSQSLEMKESSTLVEVDSALVTNSKIEYLTINQYGYQQIQNSVPIRKSLTYCVPTFSSDLFHLIITTRKVLDGFLSIETKKCLKPEGFPKGLYENLRALEFNDRVEHLLLYPAIIATQNTGFRGNTDPKQIALICRLKAVEVSGPNLEIQYIPLQSVNQMELNRCGCELGIDNTVDESTLRIEQWKVVPGDLYATLFKYNCQINQVYIQQ